MSFDSHAITIRLARSSGWLLFSRLASQGLAVLFTIFVARSLGNVGLGQFAVISSIILFGNIFAAFGLDTHLIRTIAGKRTSDPDTLSGAVWIQLILSIGFIIILVILSASLPQFLPDTRTALLLYSFSLVPSAFYKVYSAAFRAYERMDLFAGANLLLIGLQTIGAVILFFMGGDLLQLVGVIVISQFIAAFFGRLMSTKHLPAFKIRIVPSSRILKELIGLGWPLALLSGLGFLYQRTGIFLLSFLVDEGTTGLYAAAMKVAETFKIIPYVMLGSLFPVIANIYQGKGNNQPDSQAAIAYLRRITTLLIGLGIAFSFLVSVFANTIIMALFGDDFLPAIPALRILIWMVIPYAYNARITLDLVVQGQDRLATLITGFSLLFSTIVFFFMISTFGLVGAAAAAVTVEIVQALTFFLIRRKRVLIQ